MYPAAESETKQLIKKHYLFIRTIFVTVLIRETIIQGNCHRNASVP